MSSSFEKLVKYLSDNDFNYLTEEFDSKNLELLKQKDTYPYEYMNSFERFSEEKLPDKKSFYSFAKDGTTGDDGEKLDGHIGDEDYLTCKKVLNELNIKNMGDHHNHYLKKDVLLLAHVFDKSIDTCLKFCALNPCHYFSSPGLRRFAMFRMISVRLEKISDIDMYLFIKNELRGGICYIAKRYSKANNKHMNSYDPIKPSSYISYLDMNN